MDDVTVRHSDTAIVAAGVGTFGSRSMSVGGPAIAASIEKVLEKARRIAAALLEAAPADIVVDRGRFGVRGVPGRPVSLADVAAAARVRPGPAADLEPGPGGATHGDPA